MRTQTQRGEGFRWQGGQRDGERGKKGKRDCEGGGAFGTMKETKGQQERQTKGWAAGLDR